MSIFLPFGQEVSLAQRARSIPICMSLLYHNDTIIKIIFHKLGILFAVLVQNMSIYLCYHVCLRMTGIALDRLYITATQFQLSSFNSSPCLSLIMLKFLCASAQPYNMMENTYTAAHFLTQHELFLFV